MSRRDSDEVSLRSTAWWVRMGRGMVHALVGLLHTSAEPLHDKYNETTRGHANGRTLTPTLTTKAPGIANALHRLRIVFWKRHPSYQQCGPSSRNLNALIPLSYPSPSSFRRRNGHTVRGAGGYRRLYRLLSVRPRRRMDARVL